MGNTIIEADDRLADERRLSPVLQVSTPAMLPEPQRPVAARVQDYAIVQLTPEGYVATWNAAAEHLRGYRAEEIIGQHFSRFYLPEDVQRGNPERLLRLATSEGWAQDQGWRLRKDGSRYWANVVITALHDSAGGLRGFIDVARDITSIRRTHEKYRQQFEGLLQLHAEKKDLVSRLDHLRRRLDVQERERLLADERQRIARNLHDSAEQTFFAMGLMANQALKDQEVDPAAVLKRLGELAGVGAEQLRQAIFALHYADVVDRDLVSTLRSLVRSFQQRTGIEADLVLDGPRRQVSARVAETLQAVAQEALANVERHAHATAVVVTLEFGLRSVALSIQDDGVGASVLVLRRIQASTIHFGLRGLRATVRQQGGGFVARPGADGGVVVRACLPLEDQSAFEPTGGGAASVD